MALPHETLGVLIPIGNINAWVDNINTLFGGAAGQRLVSPGGGGLATWTGLNAVVANSGSDVDIATGGSAIVAFVTDATLGTSAIVLYQNTIGVTIVAQLGGATTWVTGAPATGEIQLKDNGSKLSIRAGATRNNDAVRCTYFVL